MPGWHNRLQANEQLQARNDWVEVGLIQEQHPQRCRLFMQWKRLDFPVLVDAYNLLGVQVVPITLGLDEHGVVREILRSPDQVEAFLDRTYDTKGDELPLPEIPIRAMREVIGREQTAKGREQAIQWLQARVADVKDHGAAHFALGVALRRRWESPERQPGDFQDAVDAWQDALDSNPNQYIWRRRIQQYGPRLGKPYPFYDWVETATKAITERGEKPIALQQPLTASERAGKQPFAARNVLMQPDADGRIERDGDGLIACEATLIPNRVQPGSTGRLHLALRPNTKQDGHWNNESGPTQVWIEMPPGWETDQPLSDLPGDASRATSDETRLTELEFRVPADAKGGPHELRGYALYYVCRGKEGVCLYRRQDLEFTVSVAGD